MTTFQLHKFQEQAFISDKRIIVIAAGIQSGKTTTGALWIGNKAGQIPENSNLIICAPTYKILTQATLPKFLQVFKQFGSYHKVDSIFKFHSGPTAYIRSLTDPNALEGITDVEAIWLDEGGLISRYAWENVEGRSAFRQAPILISTTPYALNWMFRMWEEWRGGKRDEVEFVQFTSKDNPHFPDEEFERQRRLLDSRRFQMKYMGQFGKMEGLVYERVNTCKSFNLEQGTKYYGGIDWGYTNPFVLTVRAITPDGVHYRIAEFYKSGLMIDEVVRICEQRKQIYNISMFIADPSAPAYIEALNRAGLTCIPGNNDVRAGIDEQSRLFKEEKFFIFEDDNPNGIDEYNTYHYPEPRDYRIDEDQKEPDPVKANDHGCDADRYVTMHLVKAQKIHMGVDAANQAQMPRDIIKRKEWLIRGGSSRFTA
jgi:PBSX family phage terminase large subunit